MADAIVIILIILAAAAAVRHVVKNRGSCSGNCGCCSGNCSGKTKKQK